MGGFLISILTEVALSSDKDDVILDYAIILHEALKLKK